MACPEGSQFVVVAPAWLGYRVEKATPDATRRSATEMEATARLTAECSPTR
jgi:hypothetical protein